MLPAFLHGKVQDFSFGPSHPKVSGRMWDGKATAQIGDCHFSLQLWHHGGENETKESLEKCLSIKALVIHNKYYDVGWHCIIKQNELWLNKQGWFGQWKGSSKTELCDFVDKSRDKSKLDYDKLRNYGFIKIV